jgi:predicted phosphodiesterase
MSKFKFSLISDMHVNHPQPKTPYDQLEEFVIVAGDTDNGLGGLKFLQKIKNKGHRVFAVDGNHEHYANLSSGRTVIETTDQFYKLLDQKNSLELEDEKILIIGVNGWYHVSSESTWQGYMNDSYYSRLSADTVNGLAHKEAFFVRHCLNNLPDGYKAIVVTHTAPCLETLNKEYEGHFSNEWYWNPEMREILMSHSDDILVWCHGHTHAKADVVVDGVRVVCNPRGYPGENPDWSPITVGS